MQQLVHMTWPAVLAFCLGTTGAIAANMISFLMIGKINASVPEREKISYVLWGGEVRGRFSRLFPDNKLIRLQNVSIIVMIIGFVLLAKFWVLS